MVLFKSLEEIEIMKRSGQIIAKVLDKLKEFVTPGISTFELNAIADETIRKYGAIPSFLNYGTPPFPGSICTSINDEVVHGIPSKKRILVEGDIVSIDVGAYIDGFHADAARTFAVGKIAEDIKKLIEVTEECFWKGMEQLKPGNRISDVSSAIEQHALLHKYGIVKELTGHGIGRSLHEDPDVPNYRTKAQGIRISEGLAVAIEPMINIGKSGVVIGDDNWTISTADRKVSAHYENTVAVTAKGNLITTILQ